MTQKNVWIINHYAGHMLTDKGGRHYWFAKYLNKQGYKVTIICSNTIHGKPELISETENIFYTKRAEEINTDFVFIKGHKYIGNGFGRTKNIYEFYRYLTREYKKIIYVVGKPDIIMASSVHPLALAAGLKIAKRCHIPCICEYRDLWPDELISMKSITENGLPAKMLRRLEYWTYKRADAIIFTMEGAKQYIVDRKWDCDNGGKVNLSKVHYICNGVDLPVYRKRIEEYRFPDEDLDSEAFKVIYTGTINKANGIDLIVDVAEILKDYKDIKFLIYGAGDEVAQIRERIKNQDLTNVIYKGRVDKQYIPYVLSKSSLNLLNYLNSDLFRYGCSNNKMFEYLASGNPILCNVKMNYSILAKYQCGIELEHNDPQTMSKKILDLYSNRDTENELRKNALTAIQNYDFEHLSARLIKIIEDLLSKK